jgi:hypothetical protein
VTAEVVDPQGRRVRLLCHRAELGRGGHSLSWDGTDDAGVAARAGIYFTRVRAGGDWMTQRIVWLR